MALTGVEGASNNYGLPEHAAWFPFQRTQILTIPDSIFAQYNSISIFIQLTRNTIDHANGVIP